MSPRPIPRRRLTAALSVLTCMGLAAATPSALAEDSAKSTRVAPGSAPSSSWSVDLRGIDDDDVNVRYADGALKLRSTELRTASAQSPAGYGSQLLPARRLDKPVDRVTAALDASVPKGASVVVDVRGRTADGVWTEWRRADRGEAALAKAVTSVQARLTLQDPRGTVRVEGLRLTAHEGAGERAAARGAVGANALSYRVFATREGLVGGTTANGHVIQPNDHFVALPSRRALSPNGSGQYSVQVCGPARCEVAPVWDVGPWNTHDDYWNPSAVRETFKDLPQGKPEAQAAYENGYNGGLDEFGRRVANPAGIDLADGTFYNVGLNDNGWVTVTYLWTGGSEGTKPFPTWGSDVRIRKEPNTTSATVSTLPGPTTVNVKCQVHGESVTYNGITNDAWSFLPELGGYLSNIFIDVADAWLPGVPNC
ncbi:hypothetical protein HUT18_29250 [Streptomyces sp. NA04227]|uniref:hypothetical protein n=1 Tax=Streptomyces sp. NA04227 TaxID=2742136 RepID=UPI001591A6A2|nr:hypothetical protein [Streptomyces sp. NA04227]QKW09890.1 hypothetical protein HUT18_29250 [Streptomyces sp. NA04227]